MVQFDTTIISNNPVSPDCWLARFEVPMDAADIKPGQFTMVKINQSHDPLMRRPFSIFRAEDAGKGKCILNIVYRLVGRGTQAMVSLVKEDRISVIAPLGNGFKTIEDKKVHVLLGGGIGAAALYMQGQAIAKFAGQNGGQIYTLLGIPNAQSLLLEKEFKSLGGKLLVSSDDGSKGFKGLVTEMLKVVLDNGSIPADCAIYACGPEPMYKSLAIICQERDIPAQVSMERHMMCGFGGCFVCVCKVNREKVIQHRDISHSHIQLNSTDGTGYALACKDGPVFDIQEVVFDG